MFHREAAFCLEAREFRLRLILNHVAAVSTKAREAQVTKGQGEQWKNDAGGMSWRPKSAQPPLAREAFAGRAMEHLNH
jgi:hypothetical protein